MNTLAAFSSEMSFECGIKVKGVDDVLDGRYY